MSRYILSPEARQDLREIKDYIAGYNKIAAMRLIESIRAKCRDLTNFPKMGRSYAELYPELRGIPLDKYIILYRLIENGVEIVRVVSGYRNLKSLFEQKDEGKEEQ